MQFGHLLEYNMRNIFVEKSYTKCDGETIPRPRPLILILLLSFLNRLAVLIQGLTQIIQDQFHIFQNTHF